MRTIPCLQIWKLSTPSCLDRGFSYFPLPVSQRSPSYLGRISTQKKADDEGFCQEDSIVPLVNTDTPYCQVQSLSQVIPVPTTSYCPCQKPKVLYRWPQLSLDYCRAAQAPKALSLQGGTSFPFNGTCLHPWWGSFHLSSVSHTSTTPPSCEEMIWDWEIFPQEDKKNILPDEELCIEADWQISGQMNLGKTLDYKHPQYKR